MALHLDFHALHSVPVSNLNSDMSRMPKTATFGGVQRARVSSQSWNAAIREHLTEEQNIEHGYRTRDILGLIGEHDPKAAEGLGKILADKSNKVLLFDTKTKQLKSTFFFTPSHLDALTTLGRTGTSEVSKALAAIVTDKTNVPIDVALFGSTLAALPEANVSSVGAAMHALSTHEVNLEFDEFVGMDDAADRNFGAHLGVNDFLSATFYRFHTINLDEMRETVGPDRVSAAIRAFTRAFAEAVPAGRRGTFNADTRPDLLLALIRQGRPEPYVNAFEYPVAPSGRGYVAPSVDALEDYHETHCATWGAPVDGWLVNTVTTTGTRFPYTTSATFGHLLDVIGDRSAGLVAP
ncbi:type I-E CRISPR-associated protein Cas7/Cse4/CasC [Aeromicrobium sp. 179-A 4D2 NHS]|uniref:type I-E CRISPR-associated protein Cas7/Cse4/CasC n=1 Tax=Aeromicrobium sp. 179-A 4D2 NHS TaxID=3142375 RepID=UPI00399FC020